MIALVHLGEFFFFCSSALNLILVLFWGGFGGCPFPLFTHYIWPIFCISYTVLGKLLIALTPSWACPKFGTLPAEGP